MKSLYNVRKYFFLISILINLLFVSVFFSRHNSKWFESGVLKRPFRENLFKSAPKKEGLIYFVGDSHTEAFELNEYLNNPLVRNRDIWGDVSNSVLTRIDNILGTKPSEIFLMIGVNDVLSGHTVESTAANVNEILNKIASEAPNAKVYLQSVLPTDNIINKTNEPAYSKIKQLNALYIEIAKKHHATFINLFPSFARSNALSKEYSADGLHLNGKGYRLWTDILKPYL